MLNTYICAKCQFIEYISGQQMQKTLKIITFSVDCCKCLPGNYNALTIAWIQKI